MANTIKERKILIGQSIKLISIPKIHDVRGNLSYVSDNEILPFSIKNVFYIYDIPAQAKRGGHAHHMLEQVLIALSGSFDVILKDSEGQQKITLNKPDEGLYIPPMKWREMENFSSGSVCLVLSSLPYDETEYIREYSEYLKYLK